MDFISLGLTQKCVDRREKKPLTNIDNIKKI